MIMDQRPQKIQVWKIIPTQLSYKYLMFLTFLIKLGVQYKHMGK